MNFEDWPQWVWHQLQDAKTLESRWPSKQEREAATKRTELTESMVTRDWTKQGISEEQAIKAFAQVSKEDLKLSLEQFQAKFYKPTEDPRLMVVKKKPGPKPKVKP